MKPIITDIDHNKLEELKLMLKPAISKSQRRDLVKRYVGNFCIGCDAIPTKLVTYDISDAEINASLVQRYCDNCYVKLTSTNGIDETLALRSESKNIKSE